MTMPADLKYKVLHVSFFDILLILIVICFSAGFILSHNRKNESNVKTAFVYKDSRLILTIDLSSKNKKTYVLENGVLEIEHNNGRIRVCGSTCPKKICMKMGWIDSPGQMIICAHNRVVIEIRAARSDVDALDAVTY